MSTFNRLLGFLRPYRRGLTISWVLASFAMVVTVALPALTGRAVEAIKQGADTPTATRPPRAPTSATRCSCWHS